MLTSEFKYVSFPFPEFNPPQAEAIKFVEQDCNLVVALNTSTGKTAVAMSFFAHEIATQQNTKCVYASPLKAISQERIEQFNEVPEWLSVTKMINTGDHFAGPDDFINSRIIILTSETLDSKARNPSLHASWLSQVGVLVLDELHLLDDPSRGTALEAGIVNFTSLNKNARVIGLSATMSNCGEIASWLKSLNGKPTYVVSSDWRPVKLNLNWVGVASSTKGNGKKWQLEQDMMHAALDIINKNPQDKTLLFVHTKRVGYDLLKTIKSNGHNCDFYHAGLKREQKRTLEQLFKSPISGLNVMITTSALAMGVNL